VGDFGITRPSGGLACGFVEAPFGREIASSIHVDAPAQIGEPLAGCLVPRLLVPRRGAAA